MCHMLIWGRMRKSSARVSVGSASFLRTLIKVCPEGGSVFKPVAIVKRPEQIKLGGCCGGSLLKA